MNKSRWLWLPARAVQNVLIAAAIATLSIFLTSADEHPYPYLTAFYSIERMGYDLLFAMRGERPERLDKRIVVVGFDYQSEQTLGKKKWPISRQHHAAVIRNLARDGASLIVYDVLLSKPTNKEDDLALDKAIKDAGNVVLPYRIDRDTDRLQLSIEGSYYDDELGIDFLANAVEGFAEVPKDVGVGGVVRRMTPLMYFQDQPVPSLAASAYLKLKGLDQSNKKNLSLKKDAIQIGDVLIPRSGPTFIDPFSAHGRKEKYEIASAYLDFPSGNNAFPLDVNFATVALNKFSKGTFKGKIVFVGVVGHEITKETNDQFVTAFSNYSPSATTGSLGLVKEIPGVFLQAMNLNALMRDGFIKKFPLEGVWVLVFGLSIAGAVAVRSSFNWRGPAILFLCTILYVTYCIQVFSHFLIYVPWVIPSFLMLGSISAITYFERGALRRKWSGYVSPQVLETILKGEQEVSAQRLRATVVFGDIRGFTNFTTMHSPETVVKLLNMQFERMTNIIYKEGGTIDKFLGDGIMVLFGAPIALQDAAIHAVRAAWKMCEATKEPLELDGEAFVLASGFGVTTGLLVAGHVGSKKRHDYTVIGEVVNLSARLQGVTGNPDVILDAETLKLVEGYVEVESLGEVFIKGLTEHMECFRVVAWRDEPRNQGRRKKPRSPEKTGISS